MHSFNSTNYSLTDEEEERIAKKKESAYRREGFGCTKCGLSILPQEYRFEEVINSIERTMPLCPRCHSKNYTECFECNEPILIDPSERHLCEGCREFYNESPIPGGR
jgi:Zn finger protein HypA/HybF involved in hydrogenase expression